MLRPSQSADDIVYEQDIIRDSSSVKPWLTYADYKLRNGTLLDRAFVRYGCAIAVLH